MKFFFQQKLHSAEKKRLSFPQSLRRLISSTGSHDSEVFHCRKPQRTKTCGENCGKLAVPAKTRGRGFGFQKIQKRLQKSEKKPKGDTLVCPLLLQAFKTSVSCETRTQVLMLLRKLVYLKAKLQVTKVNKLL